MSTNLPTGINLSPDGFPQVEGAIPVDGPRTPPAQVKSAPPIMQLAPKSKKHEKVLNYIMERINASEREMSTFYARWKANELRAQTYLSLPNYEKALKAMTDSGAPPKITSLVVPYMFSTLNTLVAYISNSFTGQKPYFSVEASKAESEQSAPNMEAFLQYNADHIRLPKRISQWAYDGLLYGVGIVRPHWTNRFASRTTRNMVPEFNELGMPVGQKEEITKEPRLVFQGTDVQNVDPFMFFPDYRVPLSEVNRKGEFVFWRTYEGMHSLKKAEASGQLQWVEHIPKMSTQTRTELISSRSLMSNGEPNPGSGVTDHSGSHAIADYIELNQGTIEITPNELGLGPGTLPEKWLFTIANKGQIIQAEPFNDDHGLHPVAIIEPYTMGYGFGQAGIADYMSAIQDALSWYLNSRIYNVRTTLNNMFLVDPAKVNTDDLLDPEPGKIIRVKPTAIGQPLDTIMKQFQVNDVTQSHGGDMQQLLRMGDNLTAAPESVRGVPTSGGAKTATEIDMVGQGAVNRLGLLVKTISSQGMSDLAEMMSDNAQQYLTDPFYVKVVGAEGMAAPITKHREDIIGDFHYPIHDGSMPLNKGGILNAWKEIFLSISQNPVLSQQYNIDALLNKLANLSGIKGLSTFRNTEEQMQQQQQQMLQQQQQQQLAQGGPGGQQQ